MTFWEELRDSSPSVRDLYDMVVNVRSGSEQTFIQYATGIKLFCEYLDAETPEEALERLSVSENREMVINRFLAWLIGERKITSSTAANRLVAVRRWLKLDGLKVDWDRVETPRKTKVTKDRPPKKEELRQLLDLADLRMKWVISALSSSGMRIGTLLKLTLKDLHEVGDTYLVEVPGYAAKGYFADPQETVYYTFTTPEAREYFERYKTYRESELGEELSEESPLVTAEKESWGGRIGDHVAYNSVRMAWTRLLRKAGLEEKESLSKLEQHRWRSLHLHTLRKFFRTQLAYARVQDDIVHKWMGHKGYLEAEYLMVDAESDAPLYEQAIPHLTISEVVELKREIDERLGTQALEIQELKDKLEERDRIVDRLMRFMEKAESKEPENGNGDSNNPGMFG